MEQLVVESAPLQAFLQDACGFDLRKAVYKQSLYESYKAWSKDQDADRVLMSAADFARELQAAASQISSKRPSIATRSRERIRSFPHHLMERSRSSDRKHGLASIAVKTINSAVRNIRARMSKARRRGAGNLRYC